MADATPQPGADVAATCGVGPGAASPGGTGAGKVVDVSTAGSAPTSPALSAIADEAASAPGPCRTWWAHLVRWLRAAHWYLRGVVGETAYENYVAHLKRHDPDAVVPSEREFWREKFAEQGKNPNTRCC